MSISRKLLVTGCAAAFAGLFCATGVQAAPASQNKVIIDNTAMVSPAQMSAFISGMKGYKLCESQHGDKYAYHVYISVTGDMGVVQVLSGPMSWAGIDAMDRDKTCNSTFMSDVLPHIASGGRAMLVLKPGFSHLPKNNPFFGRHLVTAVNITLPKGMTAGMAANKAFKKASKEIYAAINKAHWPYYGVTYDVVGGGPSSDYLFTNRNSRWAEIGANPSPTLMKVLDNAYGKSKAKAIMHSYMGAIGHSSMMVYQYDASLSYTPAGG